LPAIAPGKNLLRSKRAIRWRGLCKNQPDNAFSAASLSVAYACLGNKDAALKEAERAITLWPTAKDAMAGPGMEENLAFVETIVGEKSRAISDLGRLLTTPYPGPYYNTPLTPALLRDDPRFQKLAASSTPKAADK
jgi:hypothetical protein